MIPTIIAFLWSGLVLGVSFLATPAKFLAPSLSLAVALDVGRSTFHTLRWVEAVIALALLTALLMRRVTGRMYAVFGAVALILLLQYVVLLPMLDVRVAAIIGGQDAPPSMLHWVYTAIEFGKIALIAWLGVLLYRDDRMRPSSWRG